MHPTQISDSSPQDGVGGGGGWCLIKISRFTIWKGVFIFATCPPLFVDSHALYPQKCENLFFDSYYNAQNHHIGNILYFNLYLHKIIKRGWHFHTHIPHLHLATLKAVACVDWISICSKHEHLCHLRKVALTCHMSRAN